MKVEIEEKGNRRRHRRRRRIGRRRRRRRSSACRRRICRAPPTPTPIPVAVDPPPAPPTPSVITNPIWLRRPARRDFDRLLSEPARWSATRKAASCSIASSAPTAASPARSSSEDPPGWGFGEAAVRISRSFQMAPRLENGAADRRRPGARADRVPNGGLILLAGPRILRCGARLV